MSTHKWIDKICVAAVIFSILLTVVFMNSKVFGIEQTEHVTGYENRLFDTSRVHTIDIVMDDWEGFLETCENEEYALCSVIIDGEAYHNIGIRAKGNTSLSTVRQMDSNRYSFKFEFDQYDSSKSYYGLDKFCINNLIQDHTMMKDYLVYQMMGKMGVASPLCSYTYITVNGEDWGLYLAVEAVEESFLQRNYGNNYGDLYKPDSLNFGGGRGNGKDFDMGDFNMENFNMENFNMGDFNIEDFNIEDFNMEDFDFRQFNPNTNAQTQPSTEETSSETSEEPPTELSNNMSGQMPAGFADGMPAQMPAEFPDGMSGQMPAEFPDGMPAQMPNQTTEETTTPTSEDSETRHSPGFGFGMGSADVSLQYIDDNPESYSNIFNSAKTEVSSADQTCLIEALRKLSAGEDIEDAVDIDAVIRYFVVHNFVCNGDSYTGTMVHNYYLYEENGLLSMLPWDYNLAFGTFQAGNADSVINESIDSPVSRGELSERPMVAWIFENETYTELYHAYFKEFLETVDITGIIEEAEKLIAPYVEKDPSKFCTYEEFETGVAALKEFVSLRSESVTLQLNGDASQVNASSLTLSDMGSMGMGGMGMDMPMSKNPKGNDTETKQNSDAAQTPNAENSSDAAQTPNAENSSDTAKERTPAFPSSVQTPQTAEWALVGISVLVLIIALVIVIKFKRF